VRVLCLLLLGLLTIGVWHISPPSVLRVLFRSFVRFRFYNSNMSSAVSSYPVLTSLPMLTTISPSSIQLNHKAVIP
jgi:hypothetical protein